MVYYSNFSASVSSESSEVESELELELELELEKQLLAYPAYLEQEDVEHFEI